jgi:hypothetical protein
MNNFVSYDTALRLRAAGFPQPEVARGVVYRSERGIYAFDRGAKHSACHYLYALDHHGWVSCPVEHFEETFCFAPGPAEILRELGPDYQCGVQGTYYWCGRMPSRYASVEENLAEACAAQWLKVHEKKDSYAC